MKYDLSGRIQIRLDALGLSAAKASKDAGFSDGYIRDIERRGVQPSYNKLLRLAGVLKCDVSYLTGETNLLPVTQVGEVISVRVEGLARAGAFLEEALLKDYGEKSVVIDTVRSRKFPNAKHYALLVADDSMDKKFPDGCYAICVGFAETGLKLSAGQFVHAERGHGSGLIETTIKAVELDGAELVLSPMSHNKTYQKIPLDTATTAKVVVKGIVVGFTSLFD